MASVGYQWRVRKYLAFNAEAFTGFYRGIDEDENSIRNAIFGLGLGAGF
ncbi:MAG: hypothetical protein JW841_02420 [Deltaproteobacteria bacterium]|nr:hypothetical protein [Deltaproteobacteria bacterium]